jgi:hypothetical protein
LPKATASLEIESFNPRTVSKNASRNDELCCGQVESVGLRDCVAMFLGVEIEPFCGTISAQGPAGAHRDRLGILPAGEHVALSGYNLTGRFYCNSFSF